MTPTIRRATLFVAGLFVWVAAFALLACLPDVVAFCVLGLSLGFLSGVLMTLLALDGPRSTR